MTKNGRKNIFREEQKIKKVPLMFLDVTVLTEKKQFRFLTLSTKNQGTVYVISAKSLKISSKKGQQ